LPAIALNAARRGTLHPSDASPAPRCPIRSCSTTSPAGGGRYLAQFGGRSGSAEGGLAWFAAAYAAAIGREVRIDDIQPIVNELLAANVLMRLGHGLYGVSDPFVQKIWRERQTS